MIMLKVRETGAKKNGARLGERKMNAGPGSALTKYSTPIPSQAAFAVPAKYILDLQKFQRDTKKASACCYKFSETWRLQRGVNDDPPEGMSATGVDQSTESTEKAQAPGSSSPTTQNLHNETLV